MKSITIHGLDDELDEKIRAKAEAEGLSLNKTIKLLVRDALGIGERQDRREDFKDLLGTWSAADLEVFNRATEDFGQIDAADWK